MRRLIFILTLFTLLINPAWTAQKIVSKDISVQSIDGYNIKATLEYPRLKGKKDYHTIVLLHSLGYSSEWWESLPSDLLDSGYAVLRIDLRGHGKSVYNSRLIKTSWKDMTEAAFDKYPEDVYKVLETVTKENTKKTFFNTWSLIGADVGASTAILTADKITNKPETIVMLSPAVNIRGLYIPVTIANLSNTDIFCIMGTGEFNGLKAAEYLKKFAQAGFVTYTSTAKSTGMLMLKNDKELSKIIVSWIKEYL